ncbi:hypothetical protein L3Q82_025618, partial [Scortum barcoo]
MAVVVKTLIQARPVGKESLLCTNIPFLYRSNSDTFSTRFQEDFKPHSSKRREPVRQLPPAQMDHRDTAHIKEYQTEMKASYHSHPLPKTTHTAQWPTLCTNFKMHADLREETFLTTQSQEFQPRPFQPPPAPIPLLEATKKIQQVEKTLETTNRAFFPTHRCSPIVKATVKHLEEGFPTIKGDRCHRTSVSEYNDVFQGTRSRAAQSVKKHTSSVSMGNPVKIAETETTHAASFSWPIVCRPSMVKDRLTLNLGNFSEDSWVSTSREAFCYHKPGESDPVVPARRNRNYSSLPKGDTDVRRNKEMMSVTINRISFPDLKNTERPVYVPGPDLLTRSHVQFSPARLSGLYYTTTAKDHFSKPNGEPARPDIHLKLSGPGMTLSSIRSFTLELDGPADAAFTGGEVVSGQVVLELRRDTRVHSMKVQGRGVATAHWLENRGMNSVYNDYTSKITYFRKRQHLIRGQWRKLQVVLFSWIE